MKPAVVNMTFPEIKEFFQREVSERITDSSICVILERLNIRPKLEPSLQDFATYIETVENLLSVHGDLPQDTIMNLPERLQELYRKLTIACEELSFHLEFYIGAVQE